MAISIMLSLIVSAVATDRLVASGPLDASFGNGGVVITNLGGNSDEIRSINLLSDTSIVVTGEGFNNRGVLAKYSPLGQQDLSFGINGRRTLFDTFGSSDGVRTNDDRIAAGSAGRDALSGSSFVFNTALVTSSGLIDRSGETQASGTPQIMGARIEAQPDGKFVVVGSQVTSHGWDFAISRFNSDSSLDTGFGSGGVVLVDFSRPAVTDPADRASALAIQPDGKLLVGGFTSTTTSESSGSQVFALARYLPSGLLDPTFAGTGKFVFTSYSGNVSDIAVLPNGKILFSNNGGTETELVRLNSDGSLDTTFGSQGRLFSSNVAPLYFGANDILIDPQGRILLAGSIIPNGGSGQKFGVIRLRGDGSFDTTFAGTGYFASDFGAESYYAIRVALQPDGKILAGGWVGSLNSHDAILVRLVPEPSSGVLFAVGGAVLLIPARRHWGKPAIARRR